MHAGNFVFSLNFWFETLKFWYGFNFDFIASDDLVLWNFSFVLVEEWNPIGDYKLN